MQSHSPVSDEKQPDGAEETLHLSERERLILTLIAEGRTDNEIAMRLCLSAKTVSWYVDGIRARLDARSRAQAVAVQGEWIMAVGSKEEVLKTKGDQTVMIDLDGQTMLPGFVDPHGHMMGGGLQALSANLLAPPDGEVTSIASLQQTLKD